MEGAGTAKKVGYVRAGRAVKPLGKVLGTKVSSLRRGPNSPECRKFSSL